MPKAPSISTSLATEVKLQPRVKAIIRVQLNEYLDLQRQIKELQARQDTIKATVQDKFIDADEIDALMAGADVDGIKVKLVVGSRKSLDQKKLMKAHGLSQDDLDACTSEKQNKPYVKISGPGEKEYGGDN